MKWNKRRPWNERLSERVYSGNATGTSVYFVRPFVIQKVRLQTFRAAWAAGTSATEKLPVSNWLTVQQLAAIRGEEKWLRQWWVQSALYSTNRVDGFYREGIEVAQTHTDTQRCIYTGRMLMPADVFTVLLACWLVRSLVGWLVGWVACRETGRLLLSDAVGWVEASQWKTTKDSLWW